MLNWGTQTQKFPSRVGHALCFYCDLQFQNDISLNCVRHQFERLNCVWHQFELCSTPNAWKTVFDISLTSVWHQFNISSTSVRSFLNIHARNQHVFNLSHGAFPKSVTNPTSVWHQYGRCLKTQLPIAAQGPRAYQTHIGYTQFKLRLNRVF